MRTLNPDVMADVYSYSETEVGDGGKYSCTRDSVYTGTFVHDGCTQLLYDLLLALAENGLTYDVNNRTTRSRGHAKKTVRDWHFFTIE